MAEKCNIIRMKRQIRDHLNKEVHNEVTLRKVAEIIGLTTKFLGKEKSCYIPQEYHIVEKTK